MTLHQPANMERHTASVLAGEYDIPHLQFDAPPVVLDIGANVGAFTLWAKQRFPYCTVHGYELTQEAREYYQRNTGVTPCIGVTADGRWVAVRRGVNNLGESSVHDIGEQGDTGGEVSTMTAKALLPCDVLKIDTEGCEVEILAAYPHLKGVRAVMLEWHRAEDVPAILGILKANGFRGVCYRSTRPDNSRGILLATREEWPAKPAEPAKGEAPAKARSFEYFTERHEPPHDPKRDCSDVFIAVPIHYQPTANFMQSAMGLRDAFPGAMLRLLVGDSHPDRARNTLANEMLRGSYRWLFFLDADLKFDPRDMRRLLDHGEKFMCGFYPKKKPGMPEWVGNCDSETPDDRGFYKMREAGTGIMLVHREVLEAIIAAYPESRYTVDGDPTGREEHAIFASGVVFDELAKKRRWLSEDWEFCRRARQVGYTIYADRAVTAKHEGAALFPLLPNE